MCRTWLLSHYLSQLVNYFDPPSGYPASTVELIGVYQRLAIHYITLFQKETARNAAGYARLNKDLSQCLQLLKSCLNSRLWREVKVLEEAMWEYLDRQGWWTERLATLEMRLAAAKQANDRRDEGLCLNNLGYTCDIRGELGKALMWYEQCLSIWCELGNREGEGVTLNNIAEIYRQQGKHDEALEQYRQSLTIRRETGDREGEGLVLNNIAGVYYGLLTLFDCNHDQGKNDKPNEHDIQLVKPGEDAAEFLQSSE